jgi:hypothetical protein
VAGPHIKNDDNNNNYVCELHFRIAIKMMLGVIFVLALAGTAFGDDCCSAEDRREIQLIWNKLWEKSFTDRKVTIAKALFDE